MLHFLGAFFLGASVAIAFILVLLYFYERGQQ
jgi:hypothetical protein